MHRGGFLAHSLGSVFGTADGAGIRVLFVLMGILSTAAALLWLANPRIRNVETELPDADQTTAEKPVVEPHAPISIVDTMEEVEGAFLEP
jgi:hypothetical protein